MKTTLATAALLALVLAPLAVMAEDAPMSVFEDTLPGKVWDVVNEDLDGDGLLDIIAVTVDKSEYPPERVLSIYFQEKDAGFNAKKRVDWKAPANVAAFDVADVAASPGRELVFITEKHVSWASVTRSGVSPIKEMLEAPSVVAIPSVKEFPYYNFAWDYTGDGRDDMLVCGFYSSAFARQTDGYNFDVKQIELRPEISIFAFDISALMVSPEHPFFRVAYQVPKTYAADYNADGTPDLIAAFRETVLIFEGGKAGFSREPTETYRIKLFEDGREDRGPPPQFDFEDIDGDGRVDMVAHHITGRIGKMKSRAVLFWGDSDKIEKNEPDIEFTTEHPVMAKIIVWDVNNDGRFDLIMPTYNISAWNLGKILFTGEISVHWLYFLQNEERTFSKEPDRTITTDMKVSLTKFRLESGIPNIVADFNGDGYPDQAMGESEDVLVVTLRDKDGTPMEPTYKVEVPVAMFFRAVDLGNDGRSDIIMYYIENEEHENELRILMNQGVWETEKEGG